MIIADNETTNDLLNNEVIASTIIQTLKSSTEPLTIGVHGDWGAGKSSILRMIEKEVCQEDNTVCLHFNGWLFQGFEDAKIVLIESIVHELKKSRPGITKVADAAKEVLKRLDWLRIAKHAGGLAWTAFTGLPSASQLNSILGSLTNLIPSTPSEISSADLESAIGQLGEAVKGGDSHHVSQEIYGFRSAFEELLKAANVSKLVVLIDDLDRCLPKTAIEILEALRLFFLMPGAAFVVAADEAMIEYAVRQHFPDIAYSERAKTYTRNYLEKLIHIPFRLPPLGITETKIYVTLLLLSAEIGTEDERYVLVAARGKELMKTPWNCTGFTRSDIEKALNKKFFNELESCLALGNIIGGLVAKGTSGNPRQIKRFINTYLLRMQVAKARGLIEYIQPKVLVKMMLAEQFLPDVFEHLSREVPQSSKGISAVAGFLERDPDGELQKNIDLRKALADRYDLPEFYEWGDLEPQIYNIDLRPYLFIARDRHRIEYGGIQAGGIEALARKLSQSGIALAQEVNNIKGLSDPDVLKLCEALRDKIMSCGDYQNEPKGMSGFKLLAEHHEVAKSELLELLNNLPPEGIGNWAATGWNKALGGEHKEDVRAFLKKIMDHSSGKKKQIFEFGLNSIER